MRKWHHAKQKGSVEKDEGKGRKYRVLELLHHPDLHICDANQPWIRVGGCAIYGCNYVVVRAEESVTWERWEKTQMEHIEDDFKVQFLHATHCRYGKILGSMVHT